jgi:hypothetical protein
MNPAPINAGGIMADTPQVLTEIISGDALGLSAAARLLPAHRGAGGASATTVWRWIRTGTRTSDGRVVKLEAARIGTRWLTSKAVLTRYMTALTPVTLDAVSPVLTPTATQRQRDREAATKRLDQQLGPTKRTHSTH